MKLLYLLYFWVILAAGIFLIGYGIFLNREADALLRRGQPAQAILDGKRDDTDEDGMVAWLFDYTVAGASRPTREQVKREAYRTHQPGDTLAVICLPEAPHIARLQLNGVTRRHGYNLYFLGGLLIAAAFAIAWWTREVWMRRR
ncbi:MAG: hypothetical protein NW241_02520 [Bacteroidia bacterium]|nr:hypothetical protein [Bacteroidia bacterium]